MYLNSDSVTGKRPQSSNRRLSGGNIVSDVFGFPLSTNQFSTLQSNQFAESQRSTENEEGLVDPRTTRHLRAAAQRTDDRGNKTEWADSATVHYRNMQGTFESGNSLNPVVSESSSSFFHSFSASPSDILLQSVGPVHSLLGTGASVDDALSRMDVNDVACTLKICNKRISDAGPERSAGRPGHTPNRREFACDKTIEDSCVGPDWSAGRPGTMPFGPSTAACLSLQTSCIGPYGTVAQQQHYTGHNTCEEQSVTVPTSPLTTGLP